MQGLPEIGDVLDDTYQVEKLIGTGGFGAVYLARQLSMDREVALKILVANAMNVEEMIQRFRREVMACRNLGHPNTIRIYDFRDRPDGILYYTMEYVRGPTLKDVVKEDGPMAPSRVAHVLKQICKSLAEAHSFGIVHRDLKPANIMLADIAGETDFVKVVDFGIAKIVDDGNDERDQLTNAGVLVGTLNYMSPEQIQGGEIGPASDLYALGLIAIEMLMGRSVFEGTGRWEVLHKQISDDPVDIPEEVVNSALGSVLQTALQKPVEKRYKSAEDMLAALGGIVGLSNTPLIEVEEIGEIEMEPVGLDRPPSVAELDLPVNPVEEEPPLPEPVRPKRPTNPSGVIVGDEAAVEDENFSEAPTGMVSGDMVAAAFGGSIPEPLDSDNSAPAAAPAAEPATLVEESEGASDVPATVEQDPVFAVEDSNAAPVAAAASSEPAPAPTTPAQFGAMPVTADPPSATGTDHGFQQPSAGTDHGFEPSGDTDPGPPSSPNKGFVAIGGGVIALVIIAIIAVTQMAGGSDEEEKPPVDDGPPTEVVEAPPTEEPKEAGLVINQLERQNPTAEELAAAAGKPVKVMTPGVTAKVYNGEELLGETPLPLKVKEAMNLTLKAPGYQDAALALDKSSDEVVDVKLKKTPSTSSSSSSSSSSTTTKKPPKKDPKPKGDDGWVDITKKPKKDVPVF